LLGHGYPFCGGTKRPTGWLDGKFSAIAIIGLKYSIYLPDQAKIWKKQRLGFHECRENLHPIEKPKAGRRVKIETMPTSKRPCIFLGQPRESV
jgi:hypothetical protein